MVAVQLQQEHGYVMLVVVASFLLNIWQMMKVGGARKKFNVLYPKMYSEDKEHFNCYQVSTNIFGVRYNIFLSPPSARPPELPGAHPALPGPAGAVQRVQRAVRRR